MADTPTGETVTPEALSNVPSTTPAPIADNSGDVETAKREAEQARIRANQLQNELEKMKAEQEATRQKQLEENGKFKELWEKSEAEKAELLRASEEAERKAELETQTSNLFKDYSPTVQELARTAGMTLTDDSDAAQAELKSKLDAFASKIPSTKVEPNNPAPSAEPTPDREAAINVMRMNNIPNSAKQAAQRRAIGSLESMKTLRANAGIAEPTQ